MNFCPVCKNILYPTENKDGEENSLNVKCIKCGYHKPVTNSVIETFYYREQRHLVDNLSKNYIYDPTHARTIHKECKNENCPSKKDKSLQEAVIIPNKNNLRITYLCKPCGTEWS